MSNQNDDEFDAGWDLPFRYLLSTTVLIAVLGLLCLFWGDQLVYTFSDLWSRNGGNVIAGLSHVWFIFAWGATYTIIICLVIAGRDPFRSTAYIFGKGLWISANAGFFEELIYRWIGFSIAMIAFPFLNTITFGLLAWLYTSFLIPVANFLTLGALSGYLLHSSTWAVGAAIITANSFFRDAHLEKGFISWVNSWYIGIVLFYLMLNYGLWTAIIAHFLYDAVIFTVIAIAKGARPSTVNSRNDWYSRV